MDTYFNTFIQRFRQHELADEICFLYMDAMGEDVSGKSGIASILEEVDPTKGYQIEKQDVNDALCLVSFGSFSRLQAMVLERLHQATLHHKKGDRARLQASLEALKKEKDVPDREKIDAYIRQGMPKPSHSQRFITHYHPAYRLVSRTLMEYFDLFEEIEKAFDEKKRLVIGIDGACGSGKSTLAKMISQLYGIQPISMDDFFLPLEKRTPARLAEVGGNVDYERFVEEVKKPLQAHQPVTYRHYDCSRMVFDGTTTLGDELVYVIEGSYCMHPIINDLYDIRVFMTLPSEVQRQRILSRNGEKGFKKFEEVWIPMENRYFQACDLMAEADFLYDNSTRKGE